MTPISDGPSLDLPRLIEVLNRHEVEYLLVARCPPIDCAVPRCARWGERRRRAEASGTLTLQSPTTGRVGWEPSDSGKSDRSWLRPSAAISPCYLVK